MMSIQALQAQGSSVYQIRKREEVAGQVQEAQAVQEVEQQSDEYDKANPVGEEAEGIYSVTYDSEGKAQVKYTQPGVKAEAGGAAASTESSDSTEQEIEALKKQRDKIKQQLNKSRDDDEKKALRAQLQMIEAQIAQKTAELNS